MAIKIRRVIQPKDVDAFNRWHSAVYALDRSSFPGDDPIDIAKAYAWLAFDDKRPIGFICAEKVGAYVRVMRYGVLPSHRGSGLGTRLLRTFERFGRSLNATGAITYTTPGNSSSINALIKAGYRTYIPKPPYVGPEFVYWCRRL